MLQYRELIQKYFMKSKFKPRKGQIEIINDILTKYVDEQKRYVILAGSTGIGKSLIALIVSECLNELKGHKDVNQSYIVAHTNALLKQYYDSYEDGFDILKVMGRSNYKCSVMMGTAEHCIRSPKNSSGIDNWCRTCEYLRIKREVHKVDHFCTNYSYLFTAMGSMKKRMITIFDETHLLNEQYVNHAKIELTPIILTKMIGDMKKLGYTQQEDVLKQTQRFLTANKVHDNNYIAFLEKMRDVFEKVVSLISVEMVSALTNDNKKEYVMLNSINAKYDIMLDRINKFLDENYEHVVDIKEGSFILSAIFMRDMFQTIDTSKYYLFMSATIDKEYLITTLSLDSDDVAFVQPEPVFNPEHKNVILCDFASLNYRNMSDDKFMTSLSDQIHTIIKNHPDEKGVIQVTSFKTGNFIAKRLKNYIFDNRLNLKVVLQSSKKPLKVLLEEHKDSEKPTILISPSLFEGIDLPDDDCRFQILVKAPYYSLGDKRIKYILDRFPKIYTKLATFRMVQAIGRGVRSEEDFCDNYFIDSNLNRLFFSEHNLWQNECTIIK